MVIILYKGVSDMRIFTVFAAAFIALAVLTGCVEPVVFSEVFQQTTDQKIYTKYNIWYTDPGNISSLNIQHGSFIPVRTEIEPVSTSWAKDEIKFKTVKDGKEYTIKFSSGYRLCSMRDFIAYTFTTEPPAELLKDQPDAVKERIRRGEVVPGMNEKAVLLTYGPPPACRTADLRNESWIYWRSPSNTIRVILRDDRVRTILNVGQQL